MNDLYKCFIINLISSKPLGGILIIPLNFWSSIRKSDIQLREQFLNNFDITFNKDYPIEIKNIKNGVITPIYG